jgi:hypothetical protein
MAAPASGPVAVLAGLATPNTCRDGDASGEFLVGNHLGDGSR